MAEEKNVEVVEEKKKDNKSFLFKKVNPVLAWSIIILELVIIAFLHYAVIILKVIK